MSAFHVPFRRGLPLGLATARKRTAGGANSGRLGHAVRHPSNDDLGGTKRPPEGSGDVERERERVGGMSSHGEGITDFFCGGYVISQTLDTSWPQPICPCVLRVVNMNGVHVKFRQMGSFYFLEEQVRRSARVTPRLIRAASFCFDATSSREIGELQRSRRPNGRVESTGGPVALARSSRDKNFGVVVCVCVCVLSLH